MFKILNDPNNNIPPDKAAIFKTGLEISSGMTLGVASLSALVVRCKQLFLD